MTALLGYTFAQDPLGPTEVEECSPKMTEEEDGDYAYSFTVDIPAALEYASDDEVLEADVAMCYGEFVYNFVIEEVEALDSDDESLDITEGEDFWMWGVEASGEEDEITFEEVATDNDIYAELPEEVEESDFYEGGYLALEQAVYTTSEKNKDLEDEPAGPAY